MSTAAAQRVSAIYIVGPSSTGKTTLCNALAARLGLSSTVCITEVARTVMRQQGFTRDDVARPEMQKAIMDAQLEHDKGARGAAAAIMDGQGIVLGDRSAVDPIVYAVLNNSDPRTFTTSPDFQAALPAYRHSTSFFSTQFLTGWWMMAFAV